MKTFTNAAAQGDVYFQKIGKLPRNLKRVEPKNGRVLVTHSETGHNHEMDSRYVTMYESEGNPLVCFLQVDGAAPGGGVTLNHLRSYDTHAPIKFDSGGIYEVRRQREYVPEGFRRVED